MISTSPKLAASRNGVEPSVFGVRPFACVMRRETNGSRFSRRASGSAPAASRARATSGICRWTAAWSGARPAPSWFASAPRSIRNSAISAWPLSMATSRTEASVSSRNSVRALVSPPIPSGADSWTLAPAASSRRATSTFPCCAANSNGVKPFVDRVVAPPPVSSSTLAASVWFSAIAHISAVWPRSDSAAVGSAPADSRRRTTSTLPTRAAVNSGVTPLTRARFGSAPASSSSSTIGRLALSAARASGVTPWSSAAFTCAPASSSSRAASGSSRWDAQCRAVAPSPCGRLTSVPPATRRSARGRSPSLTASISGDSAAAAAVETVGEIPVRRNATAMNNGTR